MLHSARVHITIKMNGLFNKSNIEGGLESSVSKIC